MPHPFNQEKAVPLPTRLLLGIALLLLVPFAVAQNTLGELLDAGAKRVSGEEFRQDVVEKMLVGSTSSGGQLEFMYATSGVIQGRSLADAVGREGNVVQPIDGVWNIDDSGRICASMVILRTFLPFRCEYWFKYKDDYFLALSDSDRSAKLLRRRIKQ